MGKKSKRHSVIGNQTDEGIELPQSLDAEENIWCKQGEGDLVVPPSATWKRVFHCGEIPAYPPLRLVVDWEWKDRGYGEETGNLVFRISHNGTQVAKTRLSQTPAPHEWESKHVVFEDEALLELFEECSPHDELEIWAQSGEDQELHIRNFAFVVEGKHHMDHVEEHHEDPNALLPLRLTRSQQDGSVDDIWNDQSVGIQYISDNHDAERHIFHAGTIFGYAPKQITAEWDWRSDEHQHHHGEAPHVARLQLKFVRRGTTVAALELASREVADATWVHESVVVEDLPLLRALAHVQPGDELQLWSTVGGTFRELHVDRLKLGLIGRLTNGEDQQQIQPKTISSDLHLQLLRLPVEGEPIVYAHDEEHQFVSNSASDGFESEAVDQGQSSKEEWSRVFKSLPLRFKPSSAGGALDLSLEWSGPSQQLVVRLTRRGQVVATSSFPSSEGYDWNALQADISQSEVGINSLAGDSVELWRLSQGGQQQNAVRKIRFTAIP